jgi:NAD(P)-dependent dehydrogenase (short-subunit alcohol dehydrogenase family)
VGEVMRTYVVTGAASGIGAATTALLRRTDRVITIDRHDADITLDLSISGISDQLREAVNLFAPEGVDGVIANAGIHEPSAEMVDINFFGALETLAGLRPLLLKSRSPRALLIASAAVIHPVDDKIVQACLSGDREGANATANAALDRGEGELIYPSTKRAAVLWMRSVAASKEWAGVGIALNAIAPGMVQTPMTEAILSSDEGRARIAAKAPTPLNGVIKPEDLAKSIGWLVSAENGHMCGQTIFVDSGTEVTLRGDLERTTGLEPAT